MKKYLIFGIVIFLLGIIILVSPILINTLSSNTSENLTFTGNQNITRNLTIYTYANVTGAYLNLSADNNLGLKHFYNVEDDNTIVLDTRANSIMINITNGFNIKMISVKLNISSNGTLQAGFKSANGSGHPTGNYLISQNFTMNSTGLDKWYNLTFTNSYRLNDSKNYTLILNSNFSGGVRGQWRIDNTPLITPYYTFSTDSEVSWGGIDNNVYPMYELWGFSYVNNPYILVNNSQIWNFTGDFNKTNNKTFNFASVLNTALNSGSCNCIGCELITNNCSINFTFHSDTNGILEINNINISWLEYTNPNLTIFAPNTTYTGITYIPLNLSALDDWEIDVCSYNVTRGASTEIANTIFNCSNKTFTVSGDANYVLHLCVNDTSGNQNCTDSSFTINSYIPPPASPSSGGGGGGLPDEELSKEFSILNTNLQNIIDIKLAKDSKRPREKTLVLINREKKEITIELSCNEIDVNKSSREIDVCSYVKFANTTLVLSPNEDKPTETTFYLFTPDYSDFGEKFFVNIIAKQKDSSYFSKLSVSSDVSYLATIFYKWSYFPFQSDTNEDKSAYPVFMVSLILSMIFLIGSISIFNKAEMLLTGFLIGFTLFFLTFFLLALIL